MTVTRRNRLEKETEIMCQDDGRLDVAVAKYETALSQLNEAAQLLASLDVRIELDTTTIQTTGRVAPCPCVTCKLWRAVPLRSGR